ncbi:type II toxin-antitoxin system HipA family toxin [Mannheimia sp. AT1]|uniref:Type II toxin-antitoxin system HipA family toxin n=1 Tax=Mannheimia cairinae TaxID=3025936 RepID=A0ABT5MRT9_9PAST|nr:type II toxin-antitoxin system HipA family toxin [Mannheimia cairinae]MDD0824765.1 type II toxin-antitoxin system HipA family toxin [Mannheimia cairinae]MDD0826305.1 type II toxin-antitoxin system HipA family toxin [Mannheimia cairinae]
MVNQILTLAMNGIEVGEWRKFADGSTEFQYYPSWLESARSRAISLSLPLSNKVYRGDVVYNFFDNLLPDNELIRSRIQQRFQTTTKSPFDLLSVIGQDCVGAIQLYAKSPSSIKSILSQPLTEEEIEHTLLNYQSLPLGMKEQDDFRISLAGAQEKTALLYHQEQWHRPLASTPTTHIFKLPIGIVGQGQIDLSGSCENEWLCLQILAKFGLKVPSAKIAHFGKTQVLIVERFDRRWSKDSSHLIRLPQEDMCQAFNIAPARKYEADGGVGMLPIMQLLKGSSNAMKDQKDFFKAQILFWLLCAIDGHAKNFSIFLEPNNRFKLTPFYDVISAYPLIKPNGLQKQKVKMAMAWHGEKNKHYLWDKIQLRHIFHTAKLAGLSAQIVEEILHEICASVRGLGDISVEHIPLNITEPILSGIEKRVEMVKGTF